MAIQDISRTANDPNKLYASVRMQQGRVMVDDDWNENERIENEDRRRSRVEIIGPAGSPDDGFQIANPHVNAADRVDFDILAGTFYLGGLRLELPATQTFRAQTDFLQRPGDRHPAPANERFDLVYLMTYQEPVTAVEDSELFEVALGGPDTSTRLRTFQRVFLREGVGTTECEEAWEEVLGEWAAQGLGTLNEENELLPNATLQVGFVPGGAPDDLCTPSVAGGYLGAENQAIRVQLVNRDHLTWGFDNASPLYRVQAAGDNLTLTLLTEPKDQAHWPLAGQVVEVLPWGAVLPNGEKTAEGRGHLSRVDASYNPDTRQLTLLTAIPSADFNDWMARPDAGELGAGGPYFYLRVWNRGADRASDPAIAFTAGTPLTLGQTGLQVTITGNNRIAGDYWIIAARLETPNQVVPWDFETGRLPHGVRRFFTPLAIIHWQFSAGQLSGTQVFDCRPTFPPLTRQQSCCRFTVGDGITSRGHFDSVEEALQHLPPTGGEICLLPGFHRTNAVIGGRRSIRISGCEKRTRVSPRAGAASQPIFTVRDSGDITLQGMDLIALEGTAILAEGSAAGRLRELEINHNRILAYRNAVRVMQGEWVRIHHNRIRMLDREGGDVAIFIRAEDGAIERNDIGVVLARTVPPPDTVPPDRDGDPDPDPADPCADFGRLYLRRRGYLLAYANHVWAQPGAILISPVLEAVLPVANPFRTLGGIQVGSGSERISILENTVTGGAGNGITLGSDLDPEDFPAGTGPARPQNLRSTRDVIFGQVLLAGRPLPGASLAFQGSAGPRMTAVSNQDGNFLERAQPGEYQVTLLTPGYAIESIQTARGGEFGEIHTINVRRVGDELNLMDVLAFTYEVIISGNEITGMGLSGIGAPHLNQEDLARLAELVRRGVDDNLVVLRLLVFLVGGFGILSGVVVDLLIQENRIFRCLRNNFDEGLRTLTNLRGLGGISLGLCEDLVIRENRVEDNGTTHVTPVCGIFVAFAQQAEISHNQVLNNGPIQVNETADLLSGQRGGLVGRLGIARTLAELLGGTTGGVTGVASLVQTVLAGGRHALRIHDNVVEQPLGQALTLLAMGSVSVMNNSFTTQVSSTFNRDDILQPQGALFIGGAVNILNLGRVQLQPRFPDGNTLFSDNQTHLNYAAFSLISQVILSLDDLGFHNNQSKILVGPVLRVNTLLLSPTVRASNNRLEEPVGRGQPDNVGVGVTVGRVVVTRR